MSPPDTVLFVLHSLAVGGAETLVRRICARLPRDRFAPEVCSLVSGGPLGDDFRALDVPCHELGKREGNDPRTYWRFRRLLRRIRPAVIHTHNQDTLDFVAPVRATLLRRPRLLHTEHTRLGEEISYAERRGLKRALTRWMLHRCDRYVVIAEHVGRHLVEDQKLPAGKVEIIPNAIDVTAFPAADPAARAARRAELGAGPDTFVVGCAAAMRPQKDHATLLRAFAALADRAPDVLLALAGTGPLLEETTALARELGVAGQVRFLGARPDMAQLYHAFDVFALASLYEGLPLALLEAMACGRPAVVTRAHGNTEVIVEGETALAAPVGDAAGLGEALLRLRLDAALCGRMGTAARRRAETRYDETRMMASYEALYAGAT
jgi:glycosyltransferase involved in cell wall biosynthesis